jgi:4-amino-4-deoxy-L-arabinose transferase-like glycosyltransferase
MSTDRVFLLCAAVIVLALYFLFTGLPVFGDSYAYGYRTSRWISEHGMQPIPHGEDRGEQAMGHPAFFFWLWALLMKLLGDTAAVTRILPALATFLALAGTYRLGKQISGTVVGVLSALALLASPLFITQAFRPLPDSALVAAVAWSLYFYTRGKLKSAAICCAAAIVFREQAVFLAASYFLVELTRSGLRKPGRLLLFASPLMVIGITGILNLIVNGYLFFPTYMGAGSALESGWLAARFRFFAAHLLAEDFRWLAVTAALAVLLARGARYRLPVSSVLIILVPAIFYPPQRLVFILAVTVALAWHFLRSRRLPGHVMMVFIVFPVLLVLFHVLIVIASPDPELNLFRYVIGAYPVILTGTLALIWRAPDKRLALSISTLFIAATFISNRSMHYPSQPDASLAYLSPLQDLRAAFRYASSLGDTVVVPESNLDYMQQPSLGYISEAVPSRTLRADMPSLSQGSTYTLVISSFDGSMAYKDDVLRLLPDGMVLQSEPIRTWATGPFVTECIRITPCDTEGRD